MNKTVIGIIILSLVILIGAYFLVATPNKERSNKEKTVVEVKETSKDFGKIKLAENPETVFTLKNIGKNNLQLSGISTSCGCTAAQIIYQGKTSKEYSMHFREKDVIEIAPQTEAKVKVIYRPSTMPVYGLVEREVYITTNDPDKPKLVFKVKAFVE